MFQLKEKQAGYHANYHSFHTASARHLEPLLGHINITNKQDDGSRNHSDMTAPLLSGGMNRMTGSCNLPRKDESERVYIKMTTREGLTLLINIQR